MTSIDPRDLAAVTGGNALKTAIDIGRKVFKTAANTTCMTKSMAAGAASSSLGGLAISKTAGPEYGAAAMPALGLAANIAVNESCKVK